MNLTFTGSIILVRPVLVPEGESPPSQQLLQGAQDFLDGLGLIPPMGYSPDMMREDSLPLWSPSPLSGRRDLLTIDTESQVGQIENH